MEADTMPVVSLTVDEQKVSVLQKQAEEALQVVRSFVVVDQATHDQALEMGTLCIDIGKQWDALYREGATMADRLHKWFTGKIGAVCNPLKLAKVSLDAKAGAWERAEKERLRAEARKAEEAERKRIADERLRQAVSLEEKGRPDVAEAILEKPIEVAPVAPQKVERPRGTVAVEVYDGEVVDAALLPREYLTPDLDKLRKVTRALKGETRIPGWRVFPVDRFRRTGA